MDKGALSVAQSRPRVRAVQGVLRTVYTFHRAGLVRRSGSDCPMSGCAGDGELVLASASSRRRKILSELGVRFEVVCPPDDEQTGGTPAEMVRVNARRKLEWCRAMYPGRRILAADTVVVFDGRSLGKPVDVAEARRWFRDFSGRSQDVLTGAAYLDRLGIVHEEVVKSVVVFRSLSDTDIAGYFRSVNPLDKAGGYDIDECGERIVERWEGSRTNIMGLSVELVSRWLSRDGVL